MELVKPINLAYLRRNRMKLSILCGGEYAQFGMSLFWELEARVSNFDAAFEVLTAVTMKCIILWHVMPCSLVTFRWNVA
jgi:hypothetical protein